MYCMKCGQEITNVQANFCTRCGQRLRINTDANDIQSFPVQPQVPDAQKQPYSQPVTQPAGVMASPVQQNPAQTAKKKKSPIIGIVIALVAIILVLVAIFIFPNLQKQASKTTEDEEAASSSQTVPNPSQPVLHPSLSVDENGMNKWGNLSENMAHGGFVAYQNGWTFFSDVSSRGDLCAMSADGEVFQLTGVPAANINVMGDTLVYTDLFGTLYMRFGEDGAQSYRYPNNDMTLPSLLNDAQEDEEIIFGGYLSSITGLEEFMRTKNQDVLKLSFVDMDGALCYYPVMTENGLLVSCLKGGMMPDEALNPYTEKSVRLLGLEEESKPRMRSLENALKPQVMTLTAGTGYKPRLLASNNEPSYELLKNNGVLYLAKVEKNPDGDPLSPYQSVEYLTKIGDQKTQRTGLTPIIVKEDAIYVEVYQEPDSTENGNYQQPSLVVLSPKDYHQITKYTGRAQQKMGDNIYFLDEKGQLKVLTGDDPNPEVISEGPAISSFNLLPNGDITFTYYTDDSREVRQGIISRNTFDEAYKDAELGSGSRSSKNGWYTHMNVLEGMLEEEALASMNRSYYNDKDTFIMKKDEKGHWGWYRMTKKEDGTFDFIPQKTMRLPQDKEQENDLDSEADAGQETPIPDETPASPDNEEVISMDNPAMALIYDRLIPEASKPVKSAEEVDKLWVIGLTGRGSYKIIENGFSDYDAYIAGQREKFDDEFSSFSESTRETIYDCYPKMEEKLIGETGEITIETDALPGLEYMDIESEKTQTALEKIATDDGELTVSLAISGLDYRITPRDNETEFLILKNYAAYGAATRKDNTSLAFRYHIYHLDDDTIIMKGFFSQLNTVTTAYTVCEFECEVIDSNIG